MNNFPAPKELDAQSKIKVDRWIDVDSEEWRELDDDPALTKRMIKLGFQKPEYFFADTMGRIWGKGEDGRYYPFHFTSYGKNIGYRLPKKAAN